MKAIPFGSRRKLPSGDLGELLDQRLQTWIDLRWVGMEPGGVLREIKAFIDHLQPEASRGDFK